MCTFLLLCLVAPTAGPAKAQGAAAGILAQLRRCRAIPDATERVACYDQQVGTLQSRFGDKELAIVDRSKVERDNKVLTDADGVEVMSLETTTESVGRSVDNRLVFAVKDGSAWVQTDESPLFGIKPGGKVTLKRGAFGSYFAVFPRTVPVRVKPQR